MEEFQALVWVMLFANSTMAIAMLKRQVVCSSIISVVHQFLEVVDKPMYLAYSTFCLDNTWSVQDPSCKWLLG